MEMHIDGQYVVQLRTNKGWSQEQLAEISDLGVRTIQRLEAEGQCSLESRNALATSFGLTGDELSEGPDRAAIKRMIGNAQIAVFCVYLLCTASLCLKFWYGYHYESTISLVELMFGLVLAPILCLSVILLWNWLSRRLMQKNGIEPHPRAGLKLIGSLWKS